MGGNLGGNFRGDMISFLRPYLFYCNRSQRNYRAEHITLDKFWCAAGIETGHFVGDIPGC